MECPSCRAELAADDTRCRFCGARVTPMHEGDTPEAPVYAPAQAPPIPQPPGGPRPYRRAPAPGQNLALASLICSLASLVVCGCLAPVGAVLGYQALQQLPPDAERGAVMQAKFGMWIGGILTALMALAVLVFAALVALGVTMQP